jgi:hypothetical protein
MDKVDGHDVDKSEWIKLELFIDLDNQSFITSTSESLLSSRIDTQRSGSSGLFCFSI